MFQTDQTHLRKYLTTLGVTIAAGTLSLAGLFLKLQQDLVVTRSNLAQVTATARTALLRRQEYLSIGTAILPWFVLIGFLGGISLSVYGVVGWARRQKVIDEREDIGLRRDRVELLQLTDAEKADKLERDAEQAVRDSTPTPSAPSQSQLANARTELAELENALVGKLGALYGSYVSPSVRVQTARGSHLDVDAFVQPSDPNKLPIIFELKYSRTSNGMNTRMAEGLQQLTRILRDVNGRGVLVVITPDEATNAQLAQWKIRATDMAQAYNAQVAVYIRRYTEFLAEPAADFARELDLENVQNEAKNLSTTLAEDAESDKTGPTFL